MEDRVISLNAVKKYYPYDKKFHKWLDNLPPVTSKTGHWIKHEIEDTLRWLECSNCHCETHNVKHNYCPNCGCRMVEPQESEV